ncbi:hypothetical protein Csa_016783 [Cucumis sativus]|nr:hypothetical protein Csa_016783 [Cucumis sativus]
MYLLMMNMQKKMLSRTDLCIYQFTVLDTSFMADELITACLDDGRVFMQDGNKAMWTNQIAYAQLWIDLKMRYFFDYAIGIIEVLRSWSKVNCLGQST